MKWNGQSEYSARKKSPKKHRYAGFHILEIRWGVKYNYRILRKCAGFLLHEKRRIMEKISGYVVRWGEYDVLLSEKYGFFSEKRI